MKRRRFLHSLLGLAALTGFIKAAPTKRDLDLTLDSEENKWLSLERYPEYSYFEVLSGVVYLSDEPDPNTAINYRILETGDVTGFDHSTAKVQAGKLSAVIRLS